MHLTTLLPILSLAVNTLAGPLKTRHFGPEEYYSLGCPRNTTKPYASQYEQTKVLNTFANEVFVHQEVALGYDTYAAVNFINHAPEVAGVSISSYSIHLADLPISTHKSFGFYPWPLDHTRDVFPLLRFISIFAAAANDTLTLTEWHRNRDTLSKRRAQRRVRGNPTRLRRHQLDRHFFRHYPLSR